MFEYFDTHSHIYFPDYDADREEEIEKMKEKKIATITIGVDFETSQKAITLAESHDNLFASVGQHPGDMKTDSKFDERLIKLAQNPKAVTIGECGLDYFRLNSAEGSLLQKAEESLLQKVQKEVFQSHIDLALTVGKPLMLHIRPSDKISFDAYKDTLDILEERFKTSGDKLRGNAHFFVGNMDVLKRFLSIGFNVSFGGVLTFTHEYDEYVKYAPLSQIMSETDAPFVAPVPYRGKRNSPLYVPEVVKKIAEIRGEDFEMVKKTLCNSALNFFNI